MAKRPTTPPAPPIRSADQVRAGIARLKRRIEDVESFNPGSVARRWDPEVTALEASIKESLERVFGASTGDIRRYQSAASLDRGPVFADGRPYPLPQVQDYLTDGKAHSLSLLRQAVKGLEEDLNELGEPTAREIEPQPAAEAGRIFIVHGHDRHLLEATARFVAQLGYEPVILHEQPNQGRTLIEKFEFHARTSFAIVLATADDVGRANGESEPRPRARQNVILELGFFVGRLGRERVCLIREKGIELPSDLAGLVPIDFDDRGAWKTGLGKEMKAANFHVDWNKIM